MAEQKITRVAQLKSVSDFREHLDKIGTRIPFKERLSKVGESSLGTSLTLKSGFTVGNRFCILPMEGWDGTTDGLPTEHTHRRWHHFATSGAKLLWGCEAVAVRHDGRANPHQLLMNEENLPAFKQMCDKLKKDHAAKYGSSDDLLIGLQLTHSGRFAVPDPDRKRKPHTLYRHSVLDGKFNLPSSHEPMTDAEIDDLIGYFVRAAGLAKEAGFHFVDIKHCHGYLGHEFLSAKDRQGKYGGSLKNRLAFLRAIVEGIRSTSQIPVGVRLSAFDFSPFEKGKGNIGIPSVTEGGYGEAFGGDGTGTGIDLTEVYELLGQFEELGIELVCITAGSPYYNPHIIRPAIFPPSDGYLPPEDPLVGVGRQIQVTADIKKNFPNLVIVGSAYSYLQEWVPRVGEAVIDNKMADFIGLGRMVLSYPTMPDDILNGRTLVRGKICRTFSDCTTAPRTGMLSGCFPLDAYYKGMPEADRLKQIKKKVRL
ncbi:oxidoreductase [Pseudozobellia thermophila]|uniref:2,4-dienoyl-CoA reductase n=1 Tax=Pseudozobellia thermophila TaxID=192903 RepID=A0A1M6NY41_9FLAO|nr:NADH:flavin oxidoreductase [Pseudozobellia thermophila]SHK00560.1 2,4-dienoyl-CoA reductase [Pseudozobellia thermophila]